MSSKKALMLPFSAMLTVDAWPDKSTTEDSSLPATAAMCWAKAARSSACSVKLNSQYFDSRSWMLSRALPAAKQEPPEQLVQVLSEVKPVEELHLPAGQSLQELASNSSFQVPAGQLAHEPTPDRLL